MNNFFVFSAWVTWCKSYSKDECVPKILIICLMEWHTCIILTNMHKTTITTGYNNHMKMIHFCALYLKCNLIINVNYIFLCKDRCTDSGLIPFLKFVKILRPNICFLHKQWELRKKNTREKLHYLQIYNWVINAYFPSTSQVVFNLLLCMLCSFWVSHYTSGKKVRTNLIEFDKDVKWEISN